jgi:hypothetical protein
LIGCTVAELGGRMSSGEFGLWLEFMATEEVGADHDRGRWAVMLAALHNGPMIRRDKKQWRAREFAPPIWTPRAAPAPPPTKEQAQAAIKDFAAALGKSIRKR